MNQRYIDFVPTAKKSAAEPAPKPVEKPVETPAPKPAVSSVFVRRTVIKKQVLAPKPAPKPVAKPVAAPAPKPVAKPAPKEDTFAPARTFAPGREPFYGVVEDYQPAVTDNSRNYFNAFNGTQVEKRPLSRVNPAPKEESNNPAVVAENTELAEAKAKKIKSPLFGRKATKAAKVEEKATAKEVKTPEKPAAAPEKIEALKTPKPSPFIKSAQVEKRPLSKNVYHKPAAVPAQTEPTGPVTIIDKPERDAHVGLVIAIILTIVLGAAVGTAAFLLLPKK